ncbi:MAG: hypothetical protein KDB36_16515 [Acidimicrobiales bacterium]|nr:hypothetical protein [Acidimicrobiales bacterium]
MARLRESSSIIRLPGVGDRFACADVDDREVQVVRRRDEHVVLHLPDAPPVELDASTARAVGAFMAGRFAIDPRLVQRLDDVVGGLTFEWIRIEPGDAVVDRTIEALQIRRRTGVTIVAILRGSQAIVTPDPDLPLRGGDELVVACRDVDLDDFVRFLTGDG